MKCGVSLDSYRIQFNLSWVARVLWDYVLKHFYGFWFLMGVMYEIWRSCYYFIIGLLISFHQFLCGHK